MYLIIYGQIITLLFILGRISVAERRYGIYSVDDLRRPLYLDDYRRKESGRLKHYLDEQLRLGPRLGTLQNLVRGAGSATYKQLEKALANAIIMSRFSVMHNHDADFASDSSEENPENEPPAETISFIVKTPFRVVTLQVPRIKEIAKDVIAIPKKAYQSISETLKGNQAENGVE